LRICRLLRMTQYSKTLKRVVDTILRSLQSVISIAASNVVLVSFFGIVAKEVFYNVRPVEYLNDRTANFRSFPNALLMLFRVMTGDNWFGILYEVGNGDCREHCNEADQQIGAACQGCGSRVVAYIFFFSFYYVFGTIFINMFIPIIIDAYATPHTHAAHARRACTHACTQACTLAHTRRYISCAELDRNASYLTEGMLLHFVDVFARYVTE
jgi:hypothetical protein